MKHYEVSFAPKHKAYSDFMSSFLKASVAARAHDKQNAYAEVNKMEALIIF
jgi:hypothetical protein